jgi:hypothetical protein
VASQIGIRELLPTEKRSKKCLKLLNFVDSAVMFILFFRLLVRKCKKQNKTLFFSMNKMEQKGHFRLNPRFLLSFA